MQPSLLRPLRAALLAAALVPCGAAQAPAAAPGLPRDLDATIAAAMTAFAVPGLCVAVVRGDDTLLARGYGVQRLGDAAPVTATTRFCIASNTKLFTAVALALLVDEGKVAWDRPVQDYLPSFQLADAFVSRELTVRDLLTHRSGLALGAGDLLWWPGSTLDRAEIVRRLRHVPLATSLRSTYAYDNVLYLAAGELLAATAGVPWEQFVRDRILAPAGMRHTTACYQDARAGGDVAGGHAEVDGAVTAVTPLTNQNVDPAGGIMSCAEDLAKWLRVVLADGMLADGAPGGEARLYSAAAARELTTLVTPIRPPAQDPVLGELAPEFLGYALGLGVRDYRGLKALTHTGGLPGYVSRVFMLQRPRIGIAVLSNQESLRALDAIVYTVADALLGHADRDWLATMTAADRRARDRSTAAERAQTARRTENTRPSLPLEQYARRYRDAWCGDVTIGLQDGRLTIAFADSPLLAGVLEHWHHDTFVARWTARELRADAFVTFVLDATGAVAEVRMRKFSPDVDFSYDFEHLRLLPAPDGGR